MFKNLKSRQGFGVLELLVFAAIFSVIAISFLSILVVVTRIQVRQTGASQVNKESVFILQFVQRYVEASSLVDMPVGVTTSTLTLRMSSSTIDPTKIFLSTSTIYIQEGTGPPQPLTSPKVTIPKLEFTKYSNPPGHDSVQVSFTVAYNTQNITQKFDRTYVTAIARVSAATFDAGVYPGAVGPFQLGSASQPWASINEKIYFVGSNIGINTAAPIRAVDVELSGAGTPVFRVGNGDFFIDTANSSLGLILKSPNNNCFRVRITNTGNFVTSTATCP